MSFLDEIATFKVTFKANLKCNTSQQPQELRLWIMQKKNFGIRGLCDTLVVEAHCSECFMQMALSELTGEKANRK